MLMPRLKISSKALAPLINALTKSSKIYDCSVGDLIPMEISSEYLKIQSIFIQN